MGALTIRLANPQRVILAEISNPVFKRDSVATTYAFCIRQNEECDFPTINRAIIDRWSVSALEYIKQRAWKLVEGKQP